MENILFVGDNLSFYQKCCIEWAKTKPNIIVEYVSTKNYKQKHKEDIIFINEFI